MENGKSVKHKTSALQKNKVHPIQRILNEIIQYKYLFITCLVVCLAGAYLLNRYTTKEYVVKCSILVKDVENAMPSLQSMIYDEQNPTAPTKDLTEEVALLRSYPFVYRVLDSLDRKLSYYVEGRLGRSEIYSDLPFEMRFTDPDIYRNTKSREFKVTFRNASEYEVEEKRDTETKPLKVKTGDTVSLNNCRFFVNRTPTFRNSDINRVFFVSLQSLHTRALTMKRRLSVRSNAVTGSPVLDIYLTTAIPSRDIDFLKEYSNQFIRYKYEEKVKSASQTLDFINSQIDQVQHSLSGTETNLESFKTSTSFSDAERMTERNLDALSALENEKALLSITERYYQSILNDLNNNKSLDALVSPSSVGVKDMATEEMIRQLGALYLERKTYGNSSNPLIQGLDARMANMKNSLKENVSMLLKDTEQKMAKLNSRSGQHQSSISSLPKAERRFADIKRVNDLNESVYLMLMQKRVEAGMLKAATTVENQVIEPPILESSQPIKPNKRNNYIFAVIIAAGIAFGIISVKKALNKKITGTDDLRSISSIPVIGTVFHHAGKDPLVIHQKKRSAISESFHALRTNLILQAQHSNKKVFLITSTSSGDGKSFVSLNLAASFAQLRKKTILINLDLRVPSTSYQSISKQEPGISAFLNGSVDMADVIHSTELANLDYIGAGDLPINPTEFLISDRMDLLMSYLRLHYNYVIIDTPPIGIVSDAMILSGYSDLNIIIIRDKYTIKDKLSDLEQIYSEGKFQNVQAVINDVRIKKSAYTNKYYFKN